MNLPDDERGQRFEALVHASPDFIAIASVDGQVQFVNEAGRKLIGLPAELDVASTTIADYLTEEGLAASLEVERPAILGGGAWQGETTLRDWAGGPPIPVAVSSFLVTDLETGAPIALATVQRDLREAKAAATRVQRAELSQTMQARVLELIAYGAPLSEVLLALAEWVDANLDGTFCSILLTDEQNGTPVLRHVASPGLPLAYDEAVDGLPVSTDSSPCAVAVTTNRPMLVPDLFADPRWAPYHDLAELCDVRSCWSFPVQSQENGQVLGTFALYRSAPGLPDANLTRLIHRASHLVGIAVDRQRLVSRLEHQATHDALTGLPNRTKLLEALSEALDRRPVAGGSGPVVVFLDLDRLKIINDSLGHERGDELLARIAERLPGAVPDGVLVARFGGDEFVMLSEAISERDEAVELVEGVLAAIAQPVRLEGRLISPSASAGVVLAGAGQTATEVLRDADIAMYRAKHRGGSGYEFSDADMRQRAFDRLDLEGQLRHALSAGELRLHYQPIVDLAADGQIIGFEALVRWQHPERGLLRPASFVPLAEETGLVIPLGEWVLRTAAGEARRWAQLLDLTGMTMSVNLSVKQLAAPGLVTLVGECAAQMTPWSLGLELTESAVMDETVGGPAVLHELTEAGAELSIDDFGTGFSSLSYLTRLPVTTLKIDRSFVHELEHKPEAGAVAGAVVSLGSGLGLKVIAEGIESGPQRAALMRMGCEFGQGYLFGRPVTADDALALLKA